MAKLINDKSIKEEIKDGEAIKPVCMEKFGVDFKKTYSCYMGVKNSLEHCGTCLACKLRQEAFYWSNIKDPTNYKEKMRDFRIA